MQDVQDDGELHEMNELLIAISFDAPRLDGTALRVSRDEAKTWSDALAVDSIIGAYPSMVNLKAGSVLIVYYEEGRGSNIHARRFRVQGRDVTWQPM